VLPAGFAADRFGRKPLLVASGASGMLGVAAFIPLTDWHLAIVGSILYWSAIAGLPIMSAHIAATEAKDRLGQAMGTMFGSFFLGIIVAAPLSGIIAARYGYRATFAGAVVLFAGSTLLDLLITQSRALPAGPARRWPGAFWALLALTPLAALVAVLPTPLFSVYLRDVAAIPLERIGIYVALVSIGSAIFSALAGRLADRIGPVPAVVGAAVALTAGAGTLALGARTDLAVAAGAVLIGANQAANPVLAATIERILPPARIAVGYASFQLAYTGGFGVGGIVAGSLYEADPRLPLLVTVALSLPVAATVAIILTRIRATAGHPDRIGANI
jgi:MFS family permease